jgi:WhiB family transcriptional regulator, redox-sensing transcriptional regulator
MTLLDLHTATPIDDTHGTHGLVGPRATAVPDVAEERTGSRYARCADGNGTLTHLFFSDDEFDIARAKAICSRCGLAPECLGGALDRAEPYGVWGGELLVEGVIVAVKRGRGRPPKTARPPLVVDEVPIPPHLVA